MEAAKVFELPVGADVVAGAVPFWVDAPAAGVDGLAPKRPPADAVVLGAVVG